MYRDRLYTRSPIWLQNMWITLQGLSFETKRVSRKASMQYYHELLRSQYWTKDQIRVYQDAQFLQLLSEAIQYVPYYRALAKEMQFSIHDFQGIQDLEQLPILQKDRIRGHEADFVNERIPVRQLLRGHTSGTTGSPMRLFYTKDTFSKRWAFELRLRNWAGLSHVYHPRRVQFTGRNIVPSDQQEKIFWRFNKASNTLHCSAYHISNTTAADYAKAINRFQPEFMDGYPSSIAALSRICLNNGYKLPQVKAIRLSAETLFKHDRMCIEAAFGGRVFNQYGSSESSCFCSDNRAGEMLIHPEFGHVEILPNGELLTTSFMNPVMPLIRYRIGDIVQCSSEECTIEEGKHFQRLDSVVGRVDDVLFIRGKYVARLGAVLKDIQGLIESQMVLIEPSRLQINLVTDSLYKKDSEQVIVRNLHEKVEKDVLIDFNYLERIPRSSNGKFKAIQDLTSNFERMDIL